jgi:leucyl/phenylalanyl-tRNA--protein transferase
MERCMTQASPDSVVPVLDTSLSFPPLHQAWSRRSEAPGLLALGGDLSVARLREAYRQGIFPWYSADQPILWWSPDPRMVLATASFKWHRSLRKTVDRFRLSGQGEIRFDSDFERVIRACAQTPRSAQSGTWISEDMIQAYLALHRAGHAHSVETWWQGELVGGLYLVNLGRAVFGESMFTWITDGSKMALAALVAFCRTQHIERIDCQQNTRHLASLGAAEISRDEFSTWLQQATPLAPPVWQFDEAHWQALNSGP